MNQSLQVSSFVLILIITINTLAFSQTQNLTVTEATENLLSILNSGNLEEIEDFFDISELNDKYRANIFNPEDLFQFDRVEQLYILSKFIRVDRPLPLTNISAHYTPPDGSSFTRLSLTAEVPDITNIDPITLAANSLGVAPEEIQYRLISPTDSINYSPVSFGDLPTRELTLDLDWIFTDGAYRVSNPSLLNSLTTPPLEPKPAEDLPPTIDSLQLPQANFEIQNELEKTITELKNLRINGSQNGQQETTNGIMQNVDLTIKLEDIAIIQNNNIGENRRESFFSIPFITTYPSSVVRLQFAGFENLDFPSEAKIWVWGTLGYDKKEVGISTSFDPYWTETILVNDILNFRIQYNSQESGSLQIQKLVQVFNTEIVDYTIMNLSTPEILVLYDKLGEFPDDATCHGHQGNGLYSNTIRKLQDATVFLNIINDTRENHSFCTATRLQSYKEENRDKIFLLTANHCFTNPEDSTTEKDVKFTEVFWSYRNLECGTEGRTLNLNEQLYKEIQTKSYDVHFRQVHQPSDTVLLEVTDSDALAIEAINWSTSHPTNSHPAFRIAHPYGLPQAYSLHNSVAPFCKGVSADFIPYWFEDGRAIQQSGSSGSALVTEHGTFIGQLSHPKCLPCHKENTDSCFNFPQTSQNGKFANVWQHFQEFLGTPNSDE